MQLDNNKSTVFNENKDVLPMDIINNNAQKEEEEDEDEEEMEEDDEYVIELYFTLENEIKCKIYIIII